MSEQLENTLAQLLVPDNDVIKQVKFGFRFGILDPWDLAGYIFTHSRSRNSVIRQ